MDLFAKLLNGNTQSTDDRTQSDLQTQVAGLIVVDMRSRHGTRASESGTPLETTYFADGRPL